MGGAYGGHWEYYSERHSNPIHGSLIVKRR